MDQINVLSMAQAVTVIMIRLLDKMLLLVLLMLLELYT